jgi:formylmethanofuran--tetrahydromethanopterin N-formyltransferase
LKAEFRTERADPAARPVLEPAGRRDTVRPVNLGPTPIADTFAEAFRMWAARVIVTAADDHWLDTAVGVFTGYGTSVIGCDAECGRERRLPADATPDGRPGAAVLLFGFSADALAKALPRRTGQCLMTCPSTAVYDGFRDDPALPPPAERIPMGRHVRYFGDGFQKSKVIAGRRYWRVPVMEGEFVCEEAAGAVKAIAGGNFLIEAVDHPTALRAARRAVEAIAACPQVIAPFPGGVVRSGSKVGSRYKGLVAGTNHAFAPTLRSRVKPELHPAADCVLEIVINGLSEGAIAAAMAAGIRAAAGDGVVRISAGNYGGNLGKFHFHLHKVLAG